MIYIIDSSSLIKAFRSYRKNIFPTFWQNFDKYVDEKRIISVREVLREIQEVDDRLAIWAKSVNKEFFSEPNNKELIFVEEIFKNDHYQKLIKKSHKLTDRPIADPFLIARAKNIQNSCLITEDGFYQDGTLKKGGPTPAFICNDLNIDCINLDNFMEKENWKF